MNMDYDKMTEAERNKFIAMCVAFSESAKKNTERLFLIAAASLSLNIVILILILFR